MARRLLPAAAAVALSLAVVLALFVHLSRRSDLLDDVLATPATGDQAVVKLKHQRTTFPLPRTSVRHSGDVTLRVSARDAAASATSMAVQIVGPSGVRLAACLYPRGSFADSTILRCGVRDLSLVRRVEVTIGSVTDGLGLVGSSFDVGTLLVPRSGTLSGRLHTVLGRIGAQHPAPFTGWLVPVGTVLWLSGLLLVALWVARAPRDDA